VFVVGRPFQPRPMFVSKARELNQDIKTQKSALVEFVPSITVRKELLSRINRIYFRILFSKTHDH
jgi:hypothetical protein